MPAINKTNVNEPNYLNYIPILFLWAITLYREMNEVITLKNVANNIFHSIYKWIRKKTNKSKMFFK